jgi:hypothetical protein
MPKSILHILIYMALLTAGSFAFSCDDEVPVDITVLEVPTAKAPQGLPIVSSPLPYNGPLVSVQLEDALWTKLRVPEFKLAPTTDVVPYGFYPASHNSAPSSKPPYNVKQCDDWAWKAGYKVNHIQYHKETLQLAIMANACYMSHLVKRE